MENYSLVRMLFMVEIMKYGTLGMPRSSPGRIAQSVTCLATDASKKMG